jgi:hypothetical protein
MISKIRLFKVHNRLHFTIVLSNEPNAPINIGAFLLWYLFIELAKENSVGLGCEIYAKFNNVRVENSIDETKLWYETQLQTLEVETPEAVEFEGPLDIEMGEKAEGMILDDSLL